MKEVYKFRVGTRPLIGIKQSVAKMHVSKSDKHRVCHACFLIGTDLFEYGKNGYSRHIDVGRDPDFEWEKLGSKVNGTTYVTPEKLEDAINDGNWGKSDYDIYTHNCHHFVMFCLEQVGAGFFYDGYDHYLMDVF